MNNISSEAGKAGMPVQEKAVEEMTQEELKEFRLQFDPDQMGFDGEEGVNEDGSK